ncbi:hypothetical protein M413DRAFT_188097 [Hebeloma cylindrosporum]|uniref:Uncharacterized protein n=1 Tax=Hebeloma cylindrosporum TaxID=76867 RepID=A0A0C2YFU4_HEBCY|nr:hypothetical protein M413DRAFT_188097 [Hebeloma cylindrosporum h7]
MASTPFTIKQNIFLHEHREILVESCDLGAIKSFLPTFLASVEDNIVGLASINGPKKRMSRLILSTMTRVLIINMSSTQKNKGILRKFLLNAAIIKSAFEADKLAAALHLDFQLHITNAKDLLSVSESDRDSLDAFMGALGGETTLSKQAVLNIFQHEERATVEPTAAALQAWAACRACTVPSVAPRVKNVFAICTRSIDRQVRYFI